MALEREDKNTSDERPRVLVVDDEDLIRRVMGFILEKEFNVRTLESGTRTVELMQEDTDYDVVSLDLNMPGMSGIETLKAIKELNPTTEVLLVTAYSDVESAKQALKFGAYDYIEKPIDKETYRESVRRGVQRRQKALESLKAQKELEIVKAQLVHSEKLSAIGELLAGVVHEINNPLAGILGYSELILLGKVSPEKRMKYLENIRQSALLCQRVVQTLLAFSRKHEPRRDYVQIRDILESTLELVQHEVKVNMVQVVTQFSKGMPKTVADFYQIQQVFLNIINNALQSMKPQTRTRTVTMKGEFDEKSIRISIIDTGPGIPKANIQKIFEPFFTTKPAGKGTGLGLPICLEIIKDHAGDIYISSEPGKGSCFIVEIPVVAKPDASHPSPPSGATYPALTEWNVLVIEDKEVTGDMLSSMISALGHLADVAEEKTVAEKKLAEGNYDIIVSNIAMPSLDGPELMAYLERVKPELRAKIIFVIGGILSDETRGFLKENSAPYINKPFNLQDVQEALKTVMNGPI